MGGRLCTHRGLLLFHRIIQPDHLPQHRHRRHGCISPRTARSSPGAPTAIPGSATSAAAGRLGSSAASRIGGMQILRRSLDDAGLRLVALEEQEVTLDLGAWKNEERGGMNPVRIRRRQCFYQHAFDLSGGVEGFLRIPQGFPGDS